MQTNLRGHGRTSLSQPHLVTKAYQAYPHAMLGSGCRDDGERCRNPDQDDPVSRIIVQTGAGVEHRGCWARQSPDVLDNDGHEARREGDRRVR